MLVKQDSAGNNDPVFSLFVTRSLTHTPRTAKFHIAGRGGLSEACLMHTCEICKNVHTTKSCKTFARTHLFTYEETVLTVPTRTHCMRAFFFLYAFLLAHKIDIQLAHKIDMQRILVRLCRGWMLQRVRKAFAHMRASCQWGSRYKKSVAKVCACKLAIF
jgi:hypothetical protein